ncbi:MAG: PQQ-binding-like beta-propeller repeat protein, partial [Phycisphaeraceae bacterium]
NTSAEQTDWPHPRGGLQGLGVADVQLQSRYEPAWTYKTGGAVLSSPIIVDGVVYVGSEDKHLHAIDAKTGEAKWKLPAESLIDASPVYDRGVIYIGTDGGVLHAIDAETGKANWQFKTGGRIAGEVALTDRDGVRVVVVGSHDGLLYCLNAATGNKIWTYETGDYINCGVVLVGDTIVLGGCDTMMHLVDLDSGQGTAQIELGGEVAGTPALRDGHAYIGHMQGEVLAVDLNEKKVAWRFRDRDFPYVGSPAVTENRVLIGTRGRRLYSIDRATGEKIWDIRTRGGVEGAPVIARDRTIFGSAGGRLSIVELTDGKTVWEVDLGAGVASSPAVTDGLIVVGAEDGTIHAFKPST